MIKKYFNFIALALTFSTYSCTGVQDYVFPSLSDEEVAAPPALDEVPQAVEELSQTNLIIFYFKNYNFELSNKFNFSQKKAKTIKKKCYQPILLKYLIFAKKCNENLEIYFYENN